ncbi:MAG: DUF3135 domain-containing protein [Cellvibrionaceae bacterium]
MKFTPQKFDELMTLAQTDPQALEAYRQQQVKDLLNDAPQHLRSRLEGLQFKIDSQRSLHSSPMGACLKLSQMMQDSFHQLQDLLGDLTDGKLPHAETPQKSAKVLPFTANN